MRVVKKGDSLGFFIRTPDVFLSSVTINGCEGEGTGDFPVPDLLGEFADNWAFFLETWVIVSPLKRDFTRKGVEGTDADRSIIGSRFKVIGAGDVVVNKETVEFTAAGATCKLGINEDFVGPQGDERPL